MCNGASLTGSSIGGGGVYLYIGTMYIKVPNSVAVATGIAILSGNEICDYLFGLEGGVSLLSESDDSDRSLSIEVL